MKKTAIMAALVCTAAFLALGKVQADASESKSPSVSNGGKVLNILCWNDEFMGRVRKYCPGYTDIDNDTGLLNGTKVRWKLFPSMENTYLNALDERLSSQHNLSEDQKIDLFLVEPDYAQTYIDSPYTADMKAQIGLTESDLSQQFDYIRGLGTSSDGTLKAVSWNGCPSAMIYRRSIAKKVFGTDDPKSVQGYVSDWSKFEKTAQLLKGRGYKMLSGYDETIKAFLDNAKAPAVQDGKIVMDEACKKWIEQTKKFSQKGFNDGTIRWTSEWIRNMYMDSNVFSYFGPQWMIDFVFSGDFSDSAAYKGDWAVCKGPQNFNWGGTLICAASGTDNADLIRDMLKSLTCNADIMYRIAYETGDFVNNEKAMERLAAEGKENRFLGGQNPAAVFIEAAKSIKPRLRRRYDNEIEYRLVNEMTPYFEGKINLATAWYNFCDSMKEAFPELEE